MGLPQANLGLVVSLESRTPLLLKLFPGSADDVITLRNRAQEFRSLGVRECIIILDRGFYSRATSRC